MNESADSSTFRAVHRLVEHYTPDGTLGRTLLGGIALTFAPFLFFGGIEMLFPVITLTTSLMGLFGFVVGLSAFFVGILTLWPVYLSLIGNVESAAMYPDGASKSRPNENRESAEAILKRRYAAGELSREQFEHQLNALLETSESDHKKPRPNEERRDDERRERARNR
ncbi:SHOCT domain-containing protein [Halorussus pelagicus]|uniref:SHOCT domain-containing protein n=1 Tax=Halorussus pelagicus TaxID=2505977 RepID=UPI000FFCC3B2|nr:SHOCT domain-containing protein [Halorussus pelagicus]